MCNFYLTQCCVLIMFNVIKLSENYSDIYFRKYKQFNVLHESFTSFSYWE